MKNIPSDLEIAQAAKLKPVIEIAKKAGIREDELELYGKYKAKISLSILDRLKDRPFGKYIDVTAITPTPLGEGKTVTTIGLSLGLNKIKKKVLKGLVERYGEECQLKIHPDCSKDKIFEPDHIIPLSTNELNKKLRHLERTSDEKVPAQSFGSNHHKNLVLACSRCNAYNKHKFLPAGIIQKIL